MELREVVRAEDKPAAERIITLALTASKTQTIKGIYERIKPGVDGRIRTVLGICGTETGRLNSGDSFVDNSTNLQNLPKKTAMLDPLYDVRQCIIASPGHVLIEGDLSQAEARATAAYANDTVLLEMFDSGQDVYRLNIAEAEGITPDAVSAAMRQLGKFYVLSCGYGIGWKEAMTKINKDADITGVAVNAAKAKWLVSRYRELRAPIVAWWDEVFEEVKATGYLTNAYGRRRDFLSPYIRPTDVYASKPQSTIADHLNIGLVEAYNSGLPLALQIHDAVLLEVPERDADDAAIELRRCLNFPVRINSYDLNVPVDVKVGLRWAEMK